MGSERIELESVTISMAYTPGPWSERVYAVDVQVVALNTGETNYITSYSLTATVPAEVQDPMEILRYLLLATRINS